MSEQHGIGFRARVYYVYQMWLLRRSQQELFWRYFNMSMEKRGVTDAENETPKTKEAGDCEKPCEPACGDDPMSKMADAVADGATVKNTPEAKPVGQQ